MDKKSLQTLELIAQTLYDKKGFNILVLDVSAFSTMADTYVIAEGNVERHTKALAKELTDVLAKEGKHLYFMDAASPDWIVLDFADVVVHLMTPETREYYALEELWRKAKIVDVNIKVQGLMT
jgi:ribosome-associated protein